MLLGQMAALAVEAVLGRVNHMLVDQVLLTKEIMEVVQQFRLVVHIHLAGVVVLLR